VLAEAALTRFFACASERTHRKQTAYTESMVHIFLVNLIVRVQALAVATPIILIHEARAARDLVYLEVHNDKPSLATNGCRVTGGAA